MNDDQLDDLKQFVAPTVSQSEERLRTELGKAVSQSEERLHAELGNLRTELHDAFTGVFEALETSMQYVEERLTVHDKRLSSLENAS